MTKGTPSSKYELRGSCDERTRIRVDQANNPQGEKHAVLVPARRARKFGLVSTDARGDMSQDMAVIWTAFNVCLITWYFYCVCCASVRPLIVLSRGSETNES